MVCIYCGGDTQVVNSRPQRRTNGVWRRRRCISCNSIFTTQETADLASALRIIGQNEQILAFERAKLFVSVYECCKHLPEPAVVADELTNNVLLSLLSKKTALLSRNAVVTTTKSTLEAFDEAAGVQYAAFHKL